jgi:hypothetical protein
MAEPLSWAIIFTASKQRDAGPNVTGDGFISDYILSSAEFSLPYISSRVASIMRSIDCGA